MNQINGDGTLFEMNVKFERREQLTPDVWQYFLRPERPLDYIPGQYVDIHVPTAQNDYRGPSRIFTLTSTPNEELLSFTAKFSRPLSLYKYALHCLQPGETLRIDNAMGDVVLPKNPDIPLVFIAGGLGIASFVSILRTLEASGEQRTIHLFYALRDKQDVLFAELLDSFPFASKHAYIAPQRLTVAAIKKVATPECLVYISGSQKFVETLRTDLQAKGISHEQIIFDFFDGYTEL